MLTDKSVLPTRYWTKGMKRRVFSQEAQPAAQR
jgi:hypothetical protein